MGYKVLLWESWAPTVWITSGGPQSIAPIPFCGQMWTLLRKGQGSKSIKANATTKLISQIKVITIKQMSKLKEKGNLFLQYHVPVVQLLLFLLTSSKCAPPFCLFVSFSVILLNICVILSLPGYILLLPTLRPLPAC